MPLYNPSTGGGGGGTADAAPSDHVIEISAAPQLWTYEWTDNLWDSSLTDAACLHGKHLTSYGLVPGTNGWIEWEIPDFPAGDWTLRLTIIKTDNAGIITITLDGDVIGTLDAYALGTAYNHYESFSFSVAEAGTKPFRLACLGKNAASSDYHGFFIHAIFYRSAA